MTPRIKHNLATAGLACWLLIWTVSLSFAQKSYPTTRYRGQQLLEERQVYDLGSQLYADSNSDFQAMSPSRWSTPPVAARPAIASRKEGSNLQSKNPVKKLLGSGAFPPRRDNMDQNLDASVASKSKDSYWSQAGIDFSSASETPVRSQQRPDYKAGVNAGYPLPVSVGQAVSEASENLSSRAFAPAVPEPNRNSWLTRARVEREQSGELNPGNFGATDWEVPATKSPLNQGFRRPEITRRPNVECQPSSGHSGLESECDLDKTDSPSLEEILRTGRYFGSANVSFLKPVLQGDLAFQTSGAAGQFQNNFDYSYSTASQFNFGFESKAGPGVSVNYLEFNGTSEASSWVSPNISMGETNVDLGGVLNGIQLSDFDLNDTVTVNDLLDVQSIEASFFKEVKFKISRMGGRVGFQWVEIERQTNASVAADGSTTIEWEGKTQFQGAGPTFGLDYFRPIGHTKIEFLASGDLGLIFGQRDKILTDSAGIVFQNEGDDEFLTNLNLFLGAQYVISRGGNRCFYLRSGLDYQAWIGADNPTASNSDFGLRGFSLTLGYNR